MSASPIGLRASSIVHRVARALQCLGPSGTSVLVISGLVSGCAGQGPLATQPVALQVTAPSPEPLPTGTASPFPNLDVRVWLSGSAADIAALAELAQSFQRARPQTRFHLAYYGEEEILPALTTVALASRPTLILAPSIWGADLLQAHAILPIPHVTADEPPSGVLPLAWQSVTDESGTVFAIPVSLSGMVAYRNARLEPEAGGTVEEWVAAGATRRGPEVIGAAIDLTYETIAPWLWACRGSVSAQASHLVIDPAGGPCWARLLSKFGRAGFLGPSESGRDVFGDGRAVWWIGDAAEEDEIRISVGRDLVHVDPWPVYQVTGLTLPGFVWSEAAYLVPGSSPAATVVAEEFLMYLLSAEAQLALLNSPGTGWRTVLADLVADDPWKNQLLLALRGGVPRPVVAGSPPEAGILERAARAVVVQGTAPDLAWQDAWHALQLLATPESP